MKKKILTCLAAVAVLAGANLCMGFTLADGKTDATYCGSGTTTEHSETINYATKETVEYKIKGEVPDYYMGSEKTSCANIAGSVVIGYYDRMYEELIPNYVAYYTLGSGFFYKGMGSETQAVMDKLYTLMGTDTSGTGTTFNGFQNGMNAYVTEHGYSYSTQDLGSINLEKYKAAVESNKPVAIFLSAYSIRAGSTSDGSSETIRSVRSTVGHVVIGYGYKIDTYYNSSNQVVATRTYLRVESGLYTFGLSYLCLDGKSTIDRATAITIQ